MIRAGKRAGKAGVEYPTVTSTSEQVREAFSEPQENTGSLPVPQPSLKIIKLLRQSGTASGDACLLPKRSVKSSWRQGLPSSALEVNAAPCTRLTAVGRVCVTLRCGCIASGGGSTDIGRCLPFHARQAYFCWQTPAFPLGGTYVPRFWRARMPGISCWQEKTPRKSAGLKVVGHPHKETIHYLCLRRDGKRTESRLCLMYAHSTCPCST